MISDKDAHEKLILQTFELLHHKEQQLTLGKNCRAMALPGSAAAIVDEIFKLVKIK